MSSTVSREAANRFELMRDFFDEHVGGNAGLNSLAVGAVLGAILFALTALFKKANEIEEGLLDEVDAR